MVRSLWIIHETTVCIRELFALQRCMQSSRLASDTPGDDFESLHRQRIRGATHFKQTFHPRAFLRLRIRFLSYPYVVPTKSLFIAPCRYRKIGNSTLEARRSFSWDVIGVKTSPSVRRRRGRVSLSFSTEK